MIKFIAAIKVALLILLSGCTYNLQAEQEVSKQKNKHFPRNNISSCSDYRGNFTSIKEGGFLNETRGVLTRLKPYQKDPLFEDTIYSIELIKNAELLKSQLEVYKQKYFYFINDKKNIFQKCHSDKEERYFSFNGKTLLENINESENVVTTYLSGAPSDLAGEYQRIENLPIFRDNELKKYEVILSSRFQSPAITAINQIVRDYRKPDYDNSNNSNEESDIEILFESKHRDLERSNKDYFNAFYNWMSQPVTQAKYEGSCIQFIQIDQKDCWVISSIMKQYIDWYNVMTGEDVKSFKDIKSIKDTLALRAKIKQQLLTKLNKAEETRSRQARSDRRNAENYINIISSDIGINAIYTTPIKANKFVEEFAKGEVNRNHLGLLLITPKNDNTYYVTQVINGAVVLEPSSDYDKNIPIIVYTNRLIATGNSISQIGFKFQLKSFDSYKTVIGGNRQAIHLIHLE
jgi:hypothetical protein